MTDTDHAARYAGLQARAREVNHHLRLTVIAGPEHRGEVVTVLPLIPEPGDLPAALDAIEAYLNGPDAARRGDLYRTRDDKRQAYLDTLNATQAARQEWRDAMDAIDADADAALYPEDPADAEADALETKPAEEEMG